MSSREWIALAVMLLVILALLFGPWLYPDPAAPAQPPILNSDLSVT